MTITLAIEPTRFSMPNIVDALVEGFRTLRARRAQRLAMASLLEIDPHLLFDLGLSASDVRDALRTSRPVGPTLHARRRANALGWSPKPAIAA